MKCPECGAPIKMPDSGNQTKCEHCGNTVLAQDIFDKIKSLI
jgi:DNA-directed RNA polymerase subunit RPC12/RpoP